MDSLSPARGCFKAQRVEATKATKFAKFHLEKRASKQKTSGQTAI